jgi:hypothetical protein
MRAPPLPWRETCCACNARPASASRPMTCGRLSVYHFPSSGGRQISRTWRRHAGRVSRKRTPVVREGHLVRHRHAAAADQPDIRDGVMGGAKGAGRDQRRTVAREDHDATDAGRQVTSATPVTGTMAVSRWFNSDLRHLWGTCRSRTFPMSLCNSISWTSAVSTTANASPSTTPPSSTRPVHLYASASTPDVTGVRGLAKLRSGSRPAVSRTIFA